MHCGKTGLYISESIFLNPLTIIPAYHAMFSLPYHISSPLRSSQFDISIVCIPLSYIRVVMTNLPMQPLFSELQQHPSAVCSSCVAPSQLSSPLPFLLLLLLLLSTLLRPQAASAATMLTAVSCSAAVVG